MKAETKKKKKDKSWTLKKTEKKNQGLFYSSYYIFQENERKRTNLKGFLKCFS